MTQYVPLTSVWAAHGLAAVTIASLQDAGFTPLIECDPRGPMHYYGWPLGSQRPVTIWVPEAQRDEAIGFLAAPPEVLDHDGDGDANFWSGMQEQRHFIYSAWLLSWLLSAAAAAIY